MSRRMTRYSAVLIAFAMLFAGCSGGDDKAQDELLGRWTWSKLIVRGVTVNFADPENSTPGGTTTVTPAFLAQLGITANLTATFNADGTASASVNATIPGFAPVAQTINGTWSVSGNELRVRFAYQGRTINLAGDFEVSGSRLTISLSNAQLLELLDVNGADLSELTPDQQDLVRGLSGEIEFVR